MHFIEFDIFNILISGIPRRFERGSKRGDPEYASAARNEFSVDMRRTRMKYDYVVVDVGNRDLLALFVSLGITSRRRDYADGAVTRPFDLHIG